MSSERDIRLLLVDDDAVDRRAIRRLLEGGYTLSEAESGSQALDLFRADPPACILLDYLIPGTDSLDLLGTFVERHVPVVMLTGQGSEPVAVEAMKQGAQDYLVKWDMTADSLRRAITNAMDKVALARQLADVQAELQQFTSVASHDLKAPLARMIKLCQLLQIQCREKLSEDEQHLVDTVVSNAQRLYTFINDLLQYTQVGRSAKPLAPVDLAQVLDVVLTNLDVLIAESHARVTVDAMPTILGDDVALLQLFQNLITNALKFRGDTPPVVRLSAHREGDRWQIAVQDHGIGIAPEHYETIFAPFERLQTPGESESFGIGLATCKKIVEQHHGRIWVESELGQGTTFYMAFADAR